MLGLATSVGSLARFLGPIIVGFLYDVGRAPGAFYGSAALTFIALMIALSMRRLPLLRSQEG
jgi:MFS family permease